MDKNKIAEQAFAALPHVKEVWVTDNGHFHLAEIKGGKHFERSAEKPKAEKPKG